jgi:MFS transporter, SP family, sugar:H+ symporter
MQIVKSELPHTSLRDKSTMIHWSVANVCNFLSTFTLPYLLQSPYANLGPKVGFVYGSTTVAFVVLAFFFMPEMTNRYFFLDFIQRAVVLTVQDPWKKLMR